jgi:23S rRNA pseudouridine1911/1915/1917 synthase
MEAFQLEVDGEYRDIVEFLESALPMLPLTRIRHLVARGHAEVDGHRVDHQCVPQPGQNVTLSLPDTPIVRYEPREMDLEVLYEDAHLLVINKPAGVGVIPDPCTLDAKLINGLLYHIQRNSPFPCPRVHVVHRLDKDTTGALMVAKDLPTARHVSACFAERRVEKRYLALVRGEVAVEEGEIDLPIAQGTGGKMRLRGERGRPAESHYRVLERFRGYSLVEVRPLTGRQHQVRLHLAGIGHPVAVDPLYGGKEALYLSEIKPGYHRKEERPEAPLMGRLTLHAAHVGLDLADGTRLAVDAPLPPDFERLLRVLRKYAIRRGP